ncbi:hypothetical protein GJ744_006187 [Endocarpon pusillum]|uniref:Uncharacterized protein n=1 Tax=Endocarpon pusillum TaxID=364733 RepID=A0A8H7ASY4_9EURO|nr:hypothetical protein GJ744_006187 [Endocarpon pusillum]
MIKILPRSPSLRAIPYGLYVGAEPFAQANSVLVRGTMTLELARCWSMAVCSPPTVLDAMLGPPSLTGSHLGSRQVSGAHAPSRSQAEDES